MIEARLALFRKLDEIALHHANEFIKKKQISENLLKTIVEMYASARVEQYFKNNFFEAAYHSPITGDLEFLVSRILFHYSKNKKLGWNILLRRQKSSTAPDIRIVKGNKEIAIIEIKAKGGWIQPFLSNIRKIHCPTAISIWFF